MNYRPLDYYGFLAYLCHTRHVSKIYHLPNSNLSGELVGSNVISRMHGHQFGGLRPRFQRVGRIKCDKPDALLITNYSAD